MLTIFGTPGGTSPHLISFSKRQTVYPSKKDMNQAINLEEQLASMKATLERLCKENAEKNAKIKHKNERIADLTKKLEKQPFEACNKGSQSKELNKESKHSENSNKEHKLKKDSSLRSLSIE